jgi:alpha-beta hydrolase superfamily lysophospholipase
LSARVAALLLALLAGCGGPAPSSGPSGPPVAAWAPPGEPRAVIVALHGFSDHKGAFSELGARAAERGIMVEAYDQPGFGARADRGRWQGADALVTELRAMLADVRARYPATPVYVLGESMGGAVAVAALARPGAPTVAGLILVAPAVWSRDTLPQGYRTALRLIAGLVPPLRVNGRYLGVRASDNIEALRALGRDPLYLHETRVDAIAGLMEVMDEALEAAPRLRVRTLVLLGARDQIVPSQASREFAAQISAQPCSVVTYLNGWHLLLRDHQRERVFKDILAWVGGTPPPSRLDRPCRPADT